MIDVFSKKRRSEIMASIRDKGTKPEMVVRRLIYSMGYRYHLHRKDLPGKPDLVFAGRKKVIFVHGCFWHQHDDPKCKIRRIPKSNKDYWIPKLERNVKRDAENIKALSEMGWDILVIWECEISDLERLSNKIRDFLS